MCEIAILKAGRFTPEQLTRISMNIYTRMGSALGVVSVEPAETGGFQYDIIRGTAPAADDVRVWFEDTHEKTSHYIIHGRLATSGERNIAGVHPIPIDCDECDIDFVIHNGVYASRRNHILQSNLVSDGHSLTTSVDSETMAHQIGAIPESVSEAREKIDGTCDYQPGFILLNDERILIYARRYVLDENFEMYHSHRDFANNDAEKDYNLVVLTHDAEAQQEVPADAS